MAWRKRRKQPMSLLAFICLSCGLIFVFGNLLMLNDGFAQMFEVTFKTTVQEDGSLPSAKGSERLNWHHIELPAEALGIETPLRRLMQEKGHDNNDSGSKHSIITEDNKLQKLSQQQPHVLRVAAQDLRRSLSVSSDCHQIHNISNWSFLASGWTKAVYSGKYRGRTVAVKTIDAKGFDVSNCMQEYDLSHEDCYDKAAHKIMKETILLQGLKHPNIIEVLGHCVPETGYNAAGTQEKSHVSMVSELGEPVDLIKLLQMSWEDRLRVCYGVAKLLQYLANSPYGSVVLNDFRRQQFVLVNGEPKLSDIDDMGFGEPSCSTDHDCQHYYSSVNVTLRTTCHKGLCRGFNEKKNLFNTARHFTTFLLPHGAPPTLKPAINAIISGYSNATYSASQLLEMMESLVHSYISGEYLQRGAQDEPKTAYVEYSESDLPGLFDYRCGFSVVGSSCTVSVFDQQEAESMCDIDLQCHGLVMSSQHTWTGRTIAHLKNNFTKPSHNANTHLYVKPDRVPQFV